MSLKEDKDEDINNEDINNEYISCEDINSENEGDNDMINNEFSLEVLRPYQIDILNAAIHQNTIAFMPTGKELIGFFIYSILFYINFIIFYI
jgi:hypothetical protein